MSAASAHDESVFTEFLFNQDQYLAQHVSQYYTGYYPDISKALVCKCADRGGGHYLSGVNAPFGGIQGEDSAVQTDLFIKKFLSTLKQRGAATLTIRQAPACYQKNVSERYHTALLSNGFSLICSDINQYIEVSPQQPFTGLLDNQKRRVLRKLKEAGATCSFYESVHSGDWYEIYLKSRNYKKFPVTVTKEVYESLGSGMADTYHYIGVFLNNRLIANAILVRVHADVLYYFAGASDPDYAALSPSVFVLESLYAYAQRNKYTLVDLGISSVDCVLNEGLYQFKKHTGAMACSKNTYVYNF
jgi:hypothetical protein